MTKRSGLPWAALARLFRSWGDKVVLATALVATAIGFSWLDTRVNRAGGRLEAVDRPGSGVNVRAQVLHVWLPQSMIDIARSNSASPIAQSHQELPTALERRVEENRWYALTTRGYQANGDVADIILIRRPDREPQHFQELEDILASLASATGDPPRDPSSRYFGAKLHILPRELIEREPRAVIEELLKAQSATSDRSHD
jgi:hypothetical protein